MNKLLIDPQSPEKLREAIKKASEARTSRIQKKRSYGEKVVPGAKKPKSAGQEQIPYWLKY